MPASADVEIVGELDVVEAACAGHLCAAGVERVQHEHRRCGRGGVGSRVDASQLEAEFVEQRFAHGARRRDSKHVLGLRLIVGAFRQVEIADAEAARIGVVPLELGAEHLRAGERVLDARRKIHRVVRPADRVREVPRWERGDDRLRIERVETVSRDRERRVLLPQRAVQREAVALALLVALYRRERVARGERRVAETDVGRAAPVVEARLRDDVDRHDAGFVRVGGKHVAAESDLLDLVLRRQPAAAETVHPQRGAGPRHVAQHLLHLVGVVGQLVDLGLAEDRGERVAARIAGALAGIAADLHAFRPPLRSQASPHAVVAGADAHVPRVVRLEARRLHVNV